MKKKFSKNVQTVIDVLYDEVRGDVSAALKKITKDYSMTWVDAGIDGKELFPTTTNNMESELKGAYWIRGRQYEILHIAEGEGVIFVELIESFPKQTPKKTSKKIYSTPLVLVLEMKNGKIRTGRHYLDPRLSQKFLTKKQLAKAYQKQHPPIIVIK